MIKLDHWSRVIKQTNEQHMYEKRCNFVTRNIKILTVTAVTDSCIWSLQWSDDNMIDNVIVALNNAMISNATWKRRNYRGQNFQIGVFIQLDLKPYAIRHTNHTHKKLRTMAKKALVDLPLST